MTTQPYAPWTTGEWNLRERLGALASFQPIFEQEGYAFAETVPARRDGDLITIGWVRLGDEAMRFYHMAYDYGWVRVIDWAGWRGTAEGTRLMHDPDATAQASADDLANILTTCIRADRFCDGYLADAYEVGLIRRVVVRAGELLSENLSET